MGGDSRDGGVNPVTGARALTRGDDPPPGAERHDDVRDVRLLGRVDVPCRASRRRAASREASSPSLPGLSSGLPSTRPPSITVRATVCGASRHASPVARDFDVHLLDGGRPAVPPIRASYTLADVASKRHRGAEGARCLDRQGRACRVIEVQGELELSAYERVAARGARARRTAFDRPARPDARDPGRAGARPAPGRSRRRARPRRRAARGRDRPRGDAPRAGRRRLRSGALWLADDLDTALECCEDALLAEEGHPSALGTIDIAEHPVIARVPARGAPISSTCSSAARSTPASRSSAWGSRRTRSTSSPRDG